MDASLLVNAIIAGLLLGGFYAAVTVGISISFGMLDVVNIAHPAFIILGSYIAYIVNTTYGLDPILVALLAAAGVLSVGRGGLSGLLRRLRAARAGGAARSRLLLRPAVHHRGGADPGVRRRLPLRAGALYRADLAHRLCRFPAAHAGAVRGLRAARHRLAALLDANLHGPRRHGRGAGPAGAAIAGGRPDPRQAHRLRHFHRHRGAGGRLPHHHPADRAVGGARVYRPRVRHLRARRHGQPARHPDRGHAARHRRELSRPRSMGRRGRPRSPSASCC